MAPVIVLIFMAALLAYVASPASSSSVIPGAYWTDTQGTPIQAHGGGFLRMNDVYYWFGEDKAENSHNFRHVNAYRSNDLVTWDFLGHALSATNETSPESEIGPDAVVERPKVIYNWRTGMFVMWFHLDSSNYGLARLGVATSRTVAGPYAYLGSIAPYWEDSRDMTVWVDLDDVEQPAYLIYATRVNLDTVITRLTSDYLTLEPTPLLKMVGIHREAYAVFKTGGLFYLVSSGATGWDPNANTYMFAQSMSGPWSPQYPLAPSSSNTYGSQANYVIPVGATGFVYAGDRWNKDALSDSRYMWLPIVFGGDNRIHIDWMDEWWVDTRTGSWGPASSRLFKADGAVLEGGARIQSCTGCLDGLSVGYVGNGGRIRFDNISANQTSDYSILISYANGDGANRQASVRVNEGAGQRLSFPTTGNGNAVKPLVFQARLQLGSANTVEFYNEDSWAPDFDFIRVQCYFVNC